MHHIYQSYYYSRYYISQYIIEGGVRDGVLSVIATLHHPGLPRRGGLHASLHIYMEIYIYMFVHIIHNEYNIQFVMNSNDLFLDLATHLATQAFELLSQRLPSSAPLADAADWSSVLASHSCTCKETASSTSQFSCT